MGNLLNAHIFGRSRRGDREEVRLKLFNPDGTPADFGGGGGLNWNVSRMDPQMSLPAGPAVTDIGDPVTFTVPESGVVAVFAKIEIWNPPNTAQVSFMLDSIVLGTGSSGAGAPQPFVFSIDSGNTPRVVSLTNPAAIVVPMLSFILDPGSEHTLKWATNTANSAGGFVQKAVAGALI